MSNSLAVFHEKLATARKAIAAETARMAAERIAAPRPKQAVTPLRFSYWRGRFEIDLPSEHTESTPIALERFRESFDIGVSGLRRHQCDCGKVFYHDANSHAWEDGELEKLREDKSATPLDHPIGYIFFHLRTFVPECTCWHDTAIELMKFLDNHAISIARYLRLLKKEKQSAADTIRLEELTGPNKEPVGTCKEEESSQGVTVAGG